MWAPTLNPHPTSPHSTMNTHTLQCTACSRDHSPDMRTLQCKACASPLVVAYPPDAEPRLNAPPVSLGEGNTPVVPLPTIADSLGLNTLYAKLEFSARPVPSKTEAPPQCSPSPGNLASRS